MCEMKARSEMEIYKIDFRGSRDRTFRRIGKRLMQGQTNERMRRTANKSSSKRSYRCRHYRDYFHYGIRAVDRYLLRFPLYGEP